MFGPITAAFTWTNPFLRRLSFHISVGVACCINSCWNIKIGVGMFGTVLAQNGFENVFSVLPT